MSTKLQDEIHRSLYGNGKSRLNLETQLVASVIDYLGVQLGFKVLRRNVGGREWIDTETGKVRVVKYGQPGMADVWAIAPPTGLHIEVEVKIPGKDARANQEAWLDDVRQAGGIALCVHSLEELAEELEREFHVRGLYWSPKWRRE